MLTGREKGQCLLLLSLSSLSRIPRRFFLTPHWRSLCHVVTPSSRRVWEIEIQVLFLFSSLYNGSQEAKEVWMFVRSANWQSVCRGEEVLTAAGEPRA